MDVTPLKVALVAGEASGDRQGAALLRALSERASPRPVVAWGAGGSLMREAGVDIRHDCAPWASIGIASTAASIPHLLTVLADMKRALLANPPDVLVLIDAGAFNMPLARWVKKHRICPIFYYFPPGSWRRTPRKSSTGRNELAEVADKIVTPFPWSADILAKAGANVSFVGHPLLDLVQPTMTDTDFHERFGLDPKHPLVALLPGSRRMEIKHILPALIGAAGEISRRVVGVQFALALAPTVSRSYVETIIRREQQQPGGPAARLQLLINQAGGKLAQIAQSTLPAPVVPQLATAEGLTMPAPTEHGASERERAQPSYAPLVICEDLTYDVIARSDLVITKSGTSTLEAAILKKPMIIVYRGNSLMAMEWQLRKRSLKIPFIGLPNILAQEEIFPELLQDDATAESISEIAVRILLQPERLLRLKTRLAEVVHETLGEPGGVARAADLLYQTATSTSEAPRQIAV